MDAICAMHESLTYGVIAGTIAQLARVLRSTEIEVQSAIDELQSTGTADVKRNAKVTVDNAKVTLICRRMRKDHKVRQYNALRQSSYRRKWKSNRNSNRSVDLSSSSSSPSPGKNPSRDNPSVSPHSPAQQIFQHWLTYQNLTQHQCLNETTRKTINTRLKEGYGEEKIKLAITRYSELKAKGRAPGYNEWGLLELVKLKGGQWIDKLASLDYQGIERQGDGSWKIGMSEES